MMKGCKGYLMWIPAAGFMLVALFMFSGAKSRMKAATDMCKSGCRVSDEKGSICAH